MANVFSNISNWIKSSPSSPVARTNSVLKTGQLPVSSDDKARSILSTPGPSSSPINTALQNKATAPSITKPTTTQPTVQSLSPQIVQPTQPTTPVQTPITQPTQPTQYQTSTKEQTAIGKGEGAGNPSIYQQWLQGLTSKQTPEVEQAQKQYSDFAKASPMILSDVRNNPNVAAEVSVGRGQALGQTLSAEQQALAQGVTNALAGQSQQIGAAEQAGQLGLTQQGQQISALQNVGGLTKPEAGAAFYGSPETGNVVGTGGVGGTGNNLIDNAVSNAVGMIKSGASTSDAMATLSTLGQPAQQAFINQMRQYDLNWNPTASNAIAQQNMTQGATYQQQATQLDTGLKQLDIISTGAIDFLNKSGLNNQDNPFFNKAIKEYMSELRNPADVKTVNALMGDIKKYTGQILGATGEINPTRIGEINDTFDPSNLNPQQLTTFLANLKTLGANQLSVLQKQSTSSYGNTGGYQGTNATANTNLQTTTPNAPSNLNTENAITQGLIGGGMSIVGGIEGLFTGLASKILQ